MSAFEKDKEKYFVEVRKSMEIVSRGLSYDYRNSHCHFNPTQILFHDWIDLKDPLGESDIRKLLNMLNAPVAEVLQPIRPMTIPMF
jgi:hypothetical protein